MRKILLLIKLLIFIDVCDADTTGHVKADAIGGADEHADADAMADGDICKYPWRREQRKGLNGGCC